MGSSGGGAMELADLGVFDVLMETHPGWIIDPELRRRWNATAPW
jgi:hypothetical protein